MEVGHAPATTAAAQALAQINRRAGFAEPWNEIGWIKRAPMFAAPAHRYHGHLSLHQLTQRPAGACLPRIAVAGRIW
jgi:hypothetical protein